MGGDMPERCAQPAAVAGRLSSTAPFGSSPLSAPSAEQSLTGGNKRARRGQSLPRLAGRMNGLSKGTTPRLKGAECCAAVVTISQRERVNVVNP
jgi:hypothetical protein